MAHNGRMDVDIGLHGNEEEREYRQIYKVLIIGDSNVGKTALLTRFVEGRFQSAFMSTVGIDYKTKIISLEDEHIKMQIWDTAGQERFRTLTNAYFRGAAGALLLYDISSRTTFSSIVGWMDSIREHGSPMIRIALVGHKTDLEEDRQVTAEEGQRLADTYDCLFFEASSRNGTNCSKIFTSLALEIKQAKEDSTYLKTSIVSTIPLTTESGKLKLPSNRSSSNNSSSTKKPACCQ